MKYKIFLFLLIISATSIQAQDEYTPFDLEKMRWVIDYYGHSHSDVFEYYTDGDTIIENKTYNKLYRHHLCVINFPKRGSHSRYSIENDPKLLGALLENDKKLLFRPFNISSIKDSLITYYNLKLDSNHVLFDYDINVGDTLYFGYDKSWNQQHTRLIKHSKIKNGHREYQVYYLLPDGDANYSCTWIEGVGSTEGLFSSYNWGLHDLNCCTLNGVSIAGFRDLCDMDCPPRDKTNAIEIETINNSLNIYPNPASNIVKIISHYSPNIRRPHEILIYDLTGNSVIVRKKLTTQYTNSSTNKSYVNLIDISQIPSNLYIVKVIFDNGDYEIKKILKK